jgi:hypothetical protein
MGIDEGEEAQTKDIGNKINKGIAENIPNLKKEISIQVQEVLGYQTDMTKTEFVHSILKLKQLAQRT